jgi:hypothetical protein
MKPIHLLFALTLAMVALATQAQGTFYFWNNYPGEVDARVFDALGEPLDGSRFQATLYAGATVDSMEPIITTPFLTGGDAGYFRAQEVAVVTAIPPGSGAWLQVWAWDTVFGSTLDDVRELGVGGYGYSNIILTESGGVGDPPSLPQPLIGLQSFSLIPEPASWALFVLGSVLGLGFGRCGIRNRQKD